MSIPVYKHIFVLTKRLYGVNEKHHQQRERVRPSAAHEETVLWEEESEHSEDLRGHIPEAKQKLG